MPRKKKKRSYRQTGTSNKKRDQHRTAHRPGKRKSRSGKTYYERRKNRSDMPGQMTGVKRTSSLKTATEAQLRKILIDRVEEKRDGYVIKKYKTQLKRDKKKLQKKINICNADLRKLEKPR